MKRNKTIVALVVLMAVVMGLTVVLSSCVKPGTLKYTKKDDGTYEVARCKEAIFDFIGVETDPYTVNIPSTYKNKAVTSIGEEAFKMCNVEAVTLPDSITVIKSGAFNQVPLKSITIPDSVTTIEDGAFVNCVHLETVSLGNGITSISSSAFSCCDNLEYHGYLGNEENPYLVLLYTGMPDKDLNETVRYSYSVTEGTKVIGTNSVNSDFQWLIIPTSVTVLSPRAFGHNSKLSYITYEGTKTQWEAIIKGEDWNIGVSDKFTIHCTDGDISK